MRKGITPIIAVVLLLLITISMVGFAFVWFGDIFQQVGESTKNQTLGQIRKQGQTIKIDMASNSSGIYIRNTGNYKINLNQISVYNGTGQSLCNTTTGAVLTPGEVEICEAGCKAKETVRVTGPANEDIRTCK